VTVVDPVATTGEAITLKDRMSLPPLTIVGGLLVTGWIVVAVFAPFIATHPPTAIDLTATLQPPGAEHWLGTDNLGRDIFSRIVYGTRVDLTMGLIGVAAPLLIGIVIGLIAGFYGGMVDTLLMRLLDVTVAFPFVILVLAIIAVLGPGLTNYYIALALVAWVPYARLTRAETMVLKNAEFVQAGRVLGFPAPYIIVRHVLPNAISPSVVFVMTDIVLVILLGSGLSFLGLGAQPPTPEWGLMIAEGRTFLATAWWISVFPGFAIVLLALGFSLLADGLAQQLRVGGS
jgi:peptide/nickel transport system permease protein